jgi:hypothetical protein
MALSLQARKNIRDAEPKLAQALETIEVSHYQIVLFPKAIVSDI